MGVFGFECGEQCWACGHVVGVTQLPGCPVVWGDGVSTAAAGPASCLVDALLPGCAELGPCAAALAGRCGHVVRVWVGGDSAPHLVGWGERLGCSSYGLVWLRLVEQLHRKLADALVDLRPGDHERDEPPQDGSGVGDMRPALAA